jgi:protein gp37
MSAQTTIEWTQRTWNPTTGCDKISAGCKFCYAERMAARLLAMKQKRYQNGFKLTLQDESLQEPYKWKKGQLVFVNSMSDLFHKDVPVDYLKKVFHVMNNCTQHQFQVLTKRADRLEEIAPQLTWTSNIWIGVSVENQDCTHRIHHLRQVKHAHVRFLSIEPLLGRIEKLNLSGIDWVIVGGESGHGAREIKEEWVKEIRDRCLSKKVPFFFKQWGGVRKKRNGRLLENREWNEMPSAVHDASINLNLFQDAD